MNAPRAPELHIHDRIIDAVLAGRIKPGTRLIEQKLAEIFGVSRTRVREALMRLEAFGIVEISASRGWFVVEPSVQEAREAFEARRAIEVGLLHCVHGVGAPAIERLKAHLRDEQRAIDGGDVGERSYLLGDFHVCMAEALGNRALAEILRTLTARTVLIAMLYQSTHDAAVSCDDHVRIVAALEAGDLPLAARLMREHIDEVEEALDLQAPPDPLSGLREALSPLAPHGPHSPHSPSATDWAAAVSPNSPSLSKGAAS